MAVVTKKTNKPTAPIPLHRILREVLRHYTEYRELVNQDGRLHVIDYGYWVYNEDGGLAGMSVHLTVQAADTLTGWHRHQLGGGGKVVARTPLPGMATVVLKIPRVTGST